MNSLFFQNKNNMSKNAYTLECNSPSHLKSLSKAIAKTIQVHGFCVINAWDESYETLRIIANQFGNLQLHVRADKNGIVGENQQKDIDWQQHKSEYSGVSQEEFYPHSDGSFLNGMFLNQSTMQAICPPKMLLLQCVKHAANGGKNYLIDGKQVLEDLLKKDPEMLVKLFLPGSITFCRDDLLAQNLSIYELNVNKIKLRFRFDFATYAPEWSLSAVKKLHYKYHMNKEYRIVVDLQPAQILVVDNTRMLHARTAFDNNIVQGERKLRRAWIFDDEAPVLINVNDKAIEHRAIKPFNNYQGCQKTASLTNHAIIKYENGIRLSNEKLQKLYKLLSDKSLNIKQQVNVAILNPKR